jgi:hypothetical protein
VWRAVMRYINFDGSNISVTSEWLAKVTELNKTIHSETDIKKRSKLINDNSSLWSDVKIHLAKVFNYKCWYTESKQQGTDVDVDHYRPKNRVAELQNNDPQHYGYWWLAFELSNYRYSCIVANRRRRDIETDIVGGKADSFPILDEAHRVWDQNGNIEDEQPILLDPCKLSDVRLITFRENGEAMARENETTKPRQFQRADVSIKYYNLNHSDFVRARILLRDEMNDLLKNAKRFYNKLETGDATHDHAYETTIQRLRSFTNPNAEFSSFCLAYLENFKHEDFIAGAF